MKSSASARRRELLVERGHAQVAVAADDLDEQPLLGAEVVVQQPARDAGLARDVVEGRAGDAAPRDARAHRVDDALRLLALDGALRGSPPPWRRASWPASRNASAAPRT